MRDRRREVRSLCADLVDVRWTEPAGQVGQGTAVLEDISPSGACLQLESGIPIGAAILWECRDKRFDGEVRYCVFQEIGYLVGVEFRAGSHWSEEDYRPRHLLDPRTVSGQAKRLGGE